MADQRDAGHTDDVHPRAGVKHDRWPGWIWAIPVAAVLVVGWLGLRALLAGGQNVTIVFDDIHGIKKNNTDVMYRGMVVGRVTGVDLNAAGNAIDVTASIDDKATKFLRTRTRFWLRGANPSLSNLSSLGAVLSGPTIVMEPGPGAPRTQFAGMSSKPIRPAGDTTTLLYRVWFSGDVGSLKTGDPVELHGFTVGEVRDVGFDYDPTSGALSMPGVLALYPALFHTRGVTSPPNPTEIRSEISTLVERGLRVRLDRDPPLVGSYRVDLAMMPGSPAPITPAANDSLPQLPVAPETGLGSIITRVNQVPIDRIAQNILDITRHVDTIVASPQLRSAVNELDATLREIHTTTARAGPEITTLVASLNKAAGDLEQTVRATDRVMNGTATQTSVETTVTEITEAARAVRSLADYLDRHPEALVRGRQD